MTSTHLHIPHPLQSILNTLATHCERFEASAERNHWRLGEVEVKMQDASSERAQLEKALEAERAMRVHPPPVTDASLGSLTREEMLARSLSLSQSLYLERQKVKDLEAKVSRDHRNVVAANVAVQRYQRLQAVMVQMKKALDDRESEIQRVGAFELTIQSQEAVIAKLEGVVEGLAREAKVAKEAAVGAARERDLAVEQLRRDMTSSGAGEGGCGGGWEWQWGWQ